MRLLFILFVMLASTTVFAQEARRIVEWSELADHGIKPGDIRWKRAFDCSAQISNWNRYVEDLNKEPTDYIRQSVRDCVARVNREFEANRPTVTVTEYETITYSNLEKRYFRSVDFDDVVDGVVEKLGDYDQYINFIDCSAYDCDNEIYIWFTPGEIYAEVHKSDHDNKAAVRIDKSGRCPKGRTVSCDQIVGIDRSEEVKKNVLSGFLD